METKFCKHCGEQIDKECVICPKCGKQVEELKSAAQPNVVINNTNTNTNINGGRARKEKTSGSLSSFACSLALLVFTVSMRERLAPAFFG